jgi:hypothetical protein
MLCGCWCVGGLLLEACEPLASCSAVCAVYALQRVGHVKSTATGNTPVVLQPVHHVTMRSSRSIQWLALQRSHWLWTDPAVVHLFGDGKVAAAASLCMQQLLAGASLHPSCAISTATTLTAVPAVLDFCSAWLVVVCRTNGWSGMQATAGQMPST